MPLSRNTKLLVVFVVAAALVGAIVAAALETRSDSTSATAKRTAACPTGATGAVCSGQGTCIGGRCKCNPGYTNANCDEPVAACQKGANGRACSGNGTCISGQCKCNKGWTGAACDTLLPNCPAFGGEACSGASHGTCDTATGTCTCKAGWTGTACENPAVCKGTAAGGECDGHGTCEPTGDGNDVACSCDAGWYGEACQSSQAGKCGPDGPNGCNGHGTCAEDGSTGVYTCACEPGYVGVNCELACPTNPSTGDVCSTFKAGTTTPRFPDAQHGTCQVHVEGGVYSAACVAADETVNTASTYLGGCATNYVGSNGYQVGSATATAAGGADYEGPCTTACPMSGGVACYGNGLCVNGACLCWDSIAPHVLRNNLSISAATAGTAANTSYATFGVTFCPRSGDNACQYPVWRGVLGTTGGGGHGGNPVGFQATKTSTGKLNPADAASQAEYYDGPWRFPGTFYADPSTGAVEIDLGYDEAPHASVNREDAAKVGAKGAGARGTANTARGIHCFGNGEPQLCGTCACDEGFDPATGCQTCAPGYASAAPLATARFEKFRGCTEASPGTADSPCVQFGAGATWDGELASGEASFVYTLGGETVSALGVDTDGGCRPCFFGNCATLCDVVAQHGSDLATFCEDPTQSTSTLEAALGTTLNASMSTAQLCTAVEELNKQVAGGSPMCNGVEALSSGGFTFGCTRTLGPDGAVVPCACPYDYYRPDGGGNPTCAPSQGNCCVAKAENHTVPGAAPEHCGALGRLGETPAYVSGAASGLFSTDFIDGVVDTGCYGVPTVKNAQPPTEMYYDANRMPCTGGALTEYAKRLYSVQYQCTKCDAPKDDPTFKDDSHCCGPASWLISSSGEAAGADCGVCGTYQNLGAANHVDGLKDVFTTTAQQNDALYNVAWAYAASAKTAAADISLASMKGQYPTSGTLFSAIGATTSGSRLSLVRPTTGGCCASRCNNPWAPGNMGKQAVCDEGDDGCGGTCPFTCDMLGECRNTYTVNTGSKLLDVVMDFFEGIDEVWTEVFDAMTNTPSRTACKSGGCVFEQNCSISLLVITLPWPSKCGADYKESCPSSTTVCDDIADSYEEIRPLCFGGRVLSGAEHVVHKVANKVGSWVSHLFCATDAAGVLRPDGSTTAPSALRPGDEVVDGAGGSTRVRFVCSFAAAGEQVFAPMGGRVTGAAFTPSHRAYGAGKTDARPLHQLFNAAGVATVAGPDEPVELMLQSEPLPAASRVFAVVTESGDHVVGGVRSRQALMWGGTPAAELLLLLSATYAVATLAAAAVPPTDARAQHEVYRSATAQVFWPLRDLAAVVTGGVLPSEIVTGASAQHAEALAARKARRAAQPRKPWDNETTNAELRESAARAMKRFWADAAEMETLYPAAVWVREVMAPAARDAVLGCRRQVEFVKLLAVATKAFASCEHGAWAMLRPRDLQDAAAKAVLRRRRVSQPQQ